MVVVVFVQVVVWVAIVVSGVKSSWVMIVGVNSGHSLMPMFLIMIRSWSSISDALSLAHCFPLLFSSSLLLLGKSWSHGNGVGRSSACIGSEYASNWCTLGAGREMYGHPMVRSCLRKCHMF